MCTENIYATNSGDVTDENQVIWYTEVCGEKEGENRCDHWTEDGDTIPHNARPNEVKKVAIRYFNGDSDFDSDARTVEIRKLVNGVEVDYYWFQNQKFRRMHIHEICIRCEKFCHDGSGRFVNRFSGYIEHGSTTYHGWICGDCAAKIEAEWDEFDKELN